MATVIRAEVSDKNPYWIERHRYYELKHFCLQYPLWKKCLRTMSVSKPVGLVAFTEQYAKGISDPTAIQAEQRLFFEERIEMVEKTAVQAAGELSHYILMGVTEEKPFTALQTVHNIPCCREIYYTLYRKFFWLLSKKRQ